MKKQILCLILLLITVSTFAAHNTYRQIIDINKEWTFYPAYDNGGKIPASTIVNIPHTWNAKDVLEAKNYLRQAMWYEKVLNLNSLPDNSRSFLYFEGANSVATVYVNGHMAGEHKGGYTAFCFEITDLVVSGENTVEVLVSNAYRTDVTPLIGDFNVFGGIHRPVRLLITNENCISPLDYASSGIYIRQKSISEKHAVFEVLTKLLLTAPSDSLQVRTTVQDAVGNTVAQQTTGLTQYAPEISQSMAIDAPILWNGRRNPHLYTICVELLDDGKVVDKVVEKTGFRYFRVDPNEGFFLNGEYLNLYGFGRHEDVEGRGSALTREDYIRDFALINESGATALRLTHYPHGKPVYELSDSSGIILWTETALVGPGGFLGPGFIPSTEFAEHVHTMLVEMIRQNYNHPSICFWGLANELKFNYGDPRVLLRKLNNAAKTEDPSRPTVLATFMAEKHFAGLTDLIAWNKYFGWYETVPEDIGPFMDRMYEIHKGMPVGLSEYGAGASPFKHEYPACKPITESSWHPEEWQAVCHEGNWKELKKRPFVWGKFIWNFADFSSSVREEGDRNGVNDKGLITYDRSIKKDAFYFYKANWNPEPMLYITSRRFTERIVPITDIKIYTNAPSAELFVNGQSAGRKVKDDLNRIVWNNIRLIEGRNTITVRSKVRGKNLSDSCIWVLQRPLDSNYTQQ